MDKSPVGTFEDIMFTRYACYIIAKNGYSRKEEIAIVEGVGK